MEVSRGHCRGNQESSSRNILTQQSCGAAIIVMYSRVADAGDCASMGVAAVHRLKTPLRVAPAGWAKRPLSPLSPGDGERHGDVHELETQCV